MKATTTPTHKSKFIRRFAITFAISFIAGYAVAYWATIPRTEQAEVFATMVTAFASIFIFFGGLAVSVVTELGYYIMGASLMTPILFIFSLVILVG